MSKKHQVDFRKLNSAQLRDEIIRIHKEMQPKQILASLDTYEVDEISENGNKCYRIVPRENFDGTYIFYFYGSGTYRRMSDEQWKFIMRLAESTNVGIYVPMYPLAPENDCADVYDMLIKAYKNFSIGIDVKKIIMLGDSLGACFALGLSLLAWKEGMRQADQVILLSPIIDTEFFDKELEARVFADAVLEDRYIFTEGIKEFVNEYWVKDYATKFEYTSPFYADLTDIAKDLVIFTSDDDLFGCYAKDYYNKAKQAAVNARLFKFKNETHNFMIHSSSAEAKKAFSYLVDVINHTYNNSIFEIYPIKLISEMSTKYPNWFNAPWAKNFIAQNDFDFTEYEKKLNEYNKYLLAAKYGACDQIVKRYILQYPNATIINLGCRLDNMFERVDNGRIQWYSIGTHNIMSVRRSMFGEREREKTIGRSLMDFSWMDEIILDRNKGVMFICNDSMTYMSPNQVKSILSLLEIKFPGAEFVFTASTKSTRLLSNIVYKNSNVLKREKRQFSIGDTQATMLAWSKDYVIKSEEPIMKYLDKDVRFKLISNIKKRYNLITYNYKIIHIKLGEEAYEIKV